MVLTATADESNPGSYSLAGKLCKPECVIKLVICPEAQMHKTIDCTTLWFQLLPFRREEAT
jgi:hypothetical protein